VIEHGDSTARRHLKLRPLDRTIVRLFHDSVDRNPGKLAVRDREESFTYSELNSAASTLAFGLADQGIAKGTRCLVMLDNHAESVVVTIALALLGAVEVPINTAYRGAILERLVGESAGRVLIAEAEYLRRFESIPGRPDTTILRQALKGCYEGTAARDLPAPDITARDPVSIIYTSGTTGDSKGVISCHGEAVDFSASPGWVSEDDVVLVTLPLFHIGGKWAGVFATLIAGASAVVLERFSISSFWRDVKEYDCTQTMLVGATTNFLLGREPDEFESDNPLKKVVIGPVPPDVDQFVARFGVVAGSAYASTETSNPIISPYGTAAPGLCGWLRDDFDVRLVNTDDYEVEPGQMGELLIRPRTPWTTMLCYSNRDEATAHAWRGLWFHTGDLLRQEVDGTYYFVGRAKDVIRRRGENVTTAEVETETERHPDVIACAVIAVPIDEDEEVGAVIVLRNGADVSEQDIIEFLVPRLPYFMIPRFVKLADDLPKTPTGKILKTELGTDDFAATAWDGYKHGFTPASLRAAN
jgi:crotonobetaine/carnitine-CoA ligase